MFFKMKANVHVSLTLKKFYEIVYIILTSTISCKETEKLVLECYSHKVVCFQSNVSPYVLS
jgi:hypothetical protein